MSDGLVDKYSIGFSHRQFGLKPVIIFAKQPLTEVNGKGYYPDYQSPVKEARKPGLRVVCCYTFALFLSS